MGGPLQVLVDCPSCRVECALIELMDRGTTFGRCRLCALETAGGGVLVEGQRFVLPGEVEEALARWAKEEGEEVAVFVEANFTGLSVAQVCGAVLAGERVSTSFDVVAWLFRDRTGGSVALGGAPTLNLVAKDEPQSSEDRGAGGPPVTPPRPVPLVHTAVASERRSPPPPRDPLAVTRALIATALADGKVLAPELRVLDQLTDKLGAPRATPADWRAWRPQELGIPPDPVATIAAMRVLALADRIPDEGEARVIREFARAWRVPLPDPVLPPVTIPQKLTAQWLGLFGR